jgi:Uri superfamily endonuclease
MPASAQKRRRGRHSAHKYHRGVYNLIIRFNRECAVRKVRGAVLLLEPGLYIYTGSARGRGSTSLEQRVRRHLAHNKKHFWHIDRILQCRSAKVVAVVFAETRRNAECRVNAALTEDPRIRVFGNGIGSSDCRCRSHFLIAKGPLRSLIFRVRHAYERVGLSPHVLKDSLMGLNPQTR